MLRAIAPGTWQVLRCPGQPTEFHIVHLGSSWSIFPWHLGGGPNRGYPSADAALASLRQHFQASGIGAINPPGGVA